MNESRRSNDMTLKVPFIITGSLLVAALTLFLPDFALEARAEDRSRARRYTAWPAHPTRRPRRRRSHDRTGIVRRVLTPPALLPILAENSAGRVHPAGGASLNQRRLDTS
jgi:hypothetical protein